jgi:hypothetical protein
MAFAPITRLLRVGWHTIGPIVARVVSEHLDERRLQGLVPMSSEKCRLVITESCRSIWMSG